ncbi:MAG: SpoIIE family protein phosphatase [Rubripirellula sp.]|nr:SpoIIE family protein phosphatase [Rubripirellula sp.]
MRLERWLGIIAKRVDSTEDYNLWLKKSLRRDNAMQVPIERKSCMEITGGRKSEDVQYEMPGLRMRVFSKQSQQGLEGGGEIHFVSSCASGRITRMLIADICGSESIFKQFSCQIRDGLMKSINSIWQNRVVDEMEQQLREFAAQGGFATASIATFFAPTRSFVMCNIGNPPPIVYRKQKRNWEVIHGTQQTGESDNGDELSSIEGVFTKGEYRFIETKLEVGDHFLLYGNGFAQSTFPGGDVVGHSRLLSALQDATHTNPETRVEHLVRLIREASKDSEDSTMLACTITDQSVGLRNNLLAPIRLLRKAKDSTNLNE